MIKIVAVGLLGAFLSILLRPHRSDLAMLCGMATGAIVLLMVMDEATSLLAYLAQISDRFAVDPTMFSTMLKVTGIAYIAEFGVQACKDAGESAIASKVELGAKILILSLCVPVVMDLLELLASILP